ncbi:MAG TPA: DUF3000 family protein [Streptosporangiaceae bacterium]|jgi:hypothetical protein|nr:DUF3000 family protein [Streptosporangiaceae bacterium]
MKSADRPVRQHPAPRDTSRQGDDEAATFGAAVAQFEVGRDSQGQLRAEFTFEDIPAPRRLAPFAAATSATVRRDDTEIAWGRLVLLYDPGGQDGWPSLYRLISYLRAEVDPEIAADPMLCQVGWSWLIEALDAWTPGYGAPSGTVTRVTTEGFGGKEGDPPVHEFELRASWSPVGPAETASAVPPDAAGSADLAALDIAAHVTAWCDSLAAAAGLPPLALGAAALPAAAAAADQRSRRRR